MNAANARRLPPMTPVLRRMRQMTAIDAAGLDLVASLSDFHSYAAGAEMSGERDPTRPRFLVDGWAARVRWLADGRRQIFSLVLPGEGLGVCLRPSPLALSTTVALTPVKTVDAAPLQRALTGKDPRWDALRDAIHLLASYDEAYLLNQVLRLGRQTAHERMCHLLVELRERLALAGVGDGARIPLPLTQEILADATGLSIVHVNRILQQLRRERLIELQGGILMLLDLAELEAIADYRHPTPSARSPT